MATIGVILLLPEPWRSTLQAYRERIDDPMGDHIPPHITVVPPVDVASDHMPEVEAHLSAAAGTVAPFTVRLSGSDTFRPLSPVVFLDLAVGDDGCRRLERAVRTGPLGIDTTWPYHPHVTVAHDVDERALDAASADFADFEAEFTVEALSLFVHDGDSKWHLAREFALGAVEEEIG